MVVITRHTRVDDLPANLRTREVAAWLDVSDGAIRTMIANGTLPHVRIGRLVRVPRAALAAMADGVPTVPR